MAGKFNNRKTKRRSKKPQKFTCRPLAFAIAVALSGTLPSVANAATYFVSTTADSGAGSLRAAIIEANLTTPNQADTIEFTIATGSTINLLSELEITDSVTITGSTAGVAGSVVLDGGGSNRHINAGGFPLNSGQTITLENITLQNGMFDGTGLTFVGGGAVFVRNADLVLNHSLISGNSTIGSDANGGGLYLLSGNLTLNHSTISGNSTVSVFSRGGGISVNFGNAILTHSSVSGNSTTGADANGGGLYLLSGNLTLNHSTISGNSTVGVFSRGGGISVNFGNAILTHSSVSGNSTTGADATGGGFSVYDGNVTLTQSTVSGNSTQGNSAHGGGFYLRKVNTTLLQSTVSGNNTTGLFARGGGVDAIQSHVTLTQSTVVDNHSAYGAAGLAVNLNVFNITSTVNLTNSILSGNTNTGAGTGGNFRDRAAFANPNVTVINSVFGDPVGEITDTANSANNQYTNSPDLGPLQNNGGPTETHLPNMGSPAVNAGNNTAAAAFTNDQRGAGFARIVEGTVDIGSVERPVPITFTVNNINDSGAGSLRQAVLDANANIGVGDTILFNLPANSTIILTSELPITDSLKISGPTAGDAGSLILNGGGTNRHINAGDFSSGSGQTITLENITLQNGSFDGTAAGAGFGGGAVFVKNANLILNHSTITNNSTQGTSAQGGGLFVYNGNATLTQTTISSNSTTGGSAPGGGLSIVGGGNLTLSESTISDNTTIGTSAGGAGLYARGIVNLIRTSISENSTTGGSASGGGIKVTSGDITLKQSTVSGNSTTGNNAEGGGLYVSFSPNGATINQSTISDNSTTGLAARGGGISVYYSDASFAHSTVYDNHSAFDAAGLSASTGFSNQNVDLTHSILSGNTNTGAGTDGNLKNNSLYITVTVNNSLFGDDVSEINNIAYSSANQFTNSPDLGSLQNNGGLTLSHKPNVNSLAVNNGSSPTIPVAFDQRGIGFLRVRDGTIDIGSVELETGPFKVTNTTTMGIGSLSQARFDANNAVGADTITFDLPPGSTINLPSELVFTESVTITGPTAGDAGSVILDGGGTNRHINAGGFPVYSGQTITLENITLQNGFFDGTTAGFGFGGGAVFVKNADLILNHSYVSNNSTMGGSAGGGGLFVRNGDTTFNHSTLSGNSTSGLNAKGGGLSSTEGNVILNQSIVSGNDTTGNSAYGGGLYQVTGNFMINQSTISGNSTAGTDAYGGGLSTRNGNVTLVQSTVSGNNTTGFFARGGGINALQSDLTLTQSTVVDNHSARGAAGLEVNLNAFNVTSTVNLTNSILSGNTNTGAGTGGNFRDAAAFADPNVTVINSVFGDPVGEITDTVNSANNQYTNSPDLGPLQNNGGPTLTRLPNAGSPALDAGSNTAAAAFSDDQRGTGFTRIINGDVDIGSVESVVLPNKGKAITRAEIVKPFLQAALIEPIAATNFYGDVANNSFNADWIETFRIEGLTEGCAANSFCPNGVVTKEQLAKMIVKVKDIDISGNTYQGTFSDVPSNHPNALEIEALSSAGFTTGCAGGKYCPQSVVTHEIFNNILSEAF